MWATYTISRPNTRMNGLYIYMYSDICRCALTKLHIYMYIYSAQDLNSSCINHWPFKKLWLACIKNILSPVEATASY